MCNSANERLYNIFQSNGSYKIELDIIFLSDGYWENEVLSHLENYSNDYERDYQLYLKHDARALEIDGTLYIKETAKQDSDFRRLLLHELGHAICDFDHTERKGDIMNSHYMQWYGNNE